MERKPLVSVVIPNYNYAKTLPRCLDSLMQQTYQPLEIIVVDDGSTDNSVEIIQKYPCKLIRTQNKGVSSARNTGVAESAGEIVFFLDSDVALFEDAIANTVDAFRKDETLGSVCGIYAKEALFTDSLFEEYRTLQGYYWRKSSEGYVTAGFFSLGAVKKSVFIELGGFNENLNNSEDIEFGHRLNINYRLLLTSTVMGYHDDEHEFKRLARKMHERARQRVPFYFHRKKFTKGFETPLRGIGMMFVGLSSVALPLSLVHPLFFGLFLASLLIFLLTDFGQYTFVFKEKGPLFTMYFIVVHWLITAVVFWGFVRGLFEFATSKDFRLKYSYGE
ncbi:glycosyltransferase family 2 protein [Paenibacillus athensensis]|uniref:Glycosyl transferase family 2 n=1 Tax=Paenibacillus athensensis TaxID=1967502 RepID=A0A4Y8Q3V6_9BACL|nr:glycosyltransferase family 2 protein [Paenibacillus athensensis]MCD1258460.1 glycosyltransferase family 2 protein [Paenibacillus athensensis]